MSYVLFNNVLYIAIFHGIHPHRPDAGITWPALAANYEHFNNYRFNYYALEK